MHTLDKDFSPRAVNNLLGLDQAKHAYTTGISSPSIFCLVPPTLLLIPHLGRTTAAPPANCHPLPPPRGHRAVRSCSLDFGRALLPLCLLDLLLEPDATFPVPGASPCDARDEREGVQYEADDDCDEQRGGLGQLRRGQGGLRAGRGEEQGEEEVFRREGEQAARQLTSDGRWVEMGEANARSFGRGYEGTEPVRTR